MTLSTGDRDHSTSPPPSPKAALNEQTPAPRLRSRIYVALVWLVVRQFYSRAVEETGGMTPTPLPVDDRDLVFELAARRLLGELLYLGLVRELSR